MAMAAQPPAVPMQSNRDQIFSDILLSTTQLPLSHPSSTFPTPSIKPYSSPSSTRSHSPKGASSSGGNADEDPETKRKRNTLAARRYRQRKLDRVAELEKALKEMTKDRDDLKVALARREAEVGALREVISARR